MDPSCSHANCDIYEGTDKVPFESSLENKTDSEASTTSNLSNKVSSVEQNVNQEQIDDIEREDFEEENRLIKHCSGIIVNPEKLATTPIFPRHLSSANSSLASSSETISSLSNSTQSNYNLPGCSSKHRRNDDSNTTIKKMIFARKLVFTSQPENPKTIIHKNLKNLVNSSTSATAKLNELNNKASSSIIKEVNSTLGKGDQQLKSVVRSELGSNDATEQPDPAHSVNEGVESTSTRTNSNASSIVSTSSDNVRDYSAASTSDAQKLNSTDDISDCKPEPAIANKSTTTSDFLEQYCAVEESDEEYNEEAWCTCLSAHEDEDKSFDAEDSDNGASEDSGRVWRKRKYDILSSLTGSSQPKKFCSDVTTSGANGLESVWPPNLPGCSIGPSPLPIQGPPEVKQWLGKFNTWSNADRLMAIDALINRCSASQVRHMMKAIEPLFQRDFISLLPKELALTVLGYLQPKDLLRAAQTCQYWRFLADDNLLWKEQCRRIGITTLKKRPRSLPNCASPWKTAYMRQYIIENNWLTRPVGQPIVMKGHDDHVITCLQFYGNRILSGSDDTTLKVWSAITGKCLRTLVGHSGGVWSSQMFENLVISGSTDRTLRVWNAETGVCQKTLAGHTSTVRCMHLYKDRVVSGSRDATLRVWSISEGRCLRVLVGHLAAVRCVQYDGKVVVSGAYDYFVKVWNPDSGECLHTLAGHTNRVYSLQFDGVHVVSGSLDTSIRVWDVESGQLKHTLIGHQSLTSGMELHSNILVSGNADSTVKVWDITTGHCLHTLSGPNKHQSAVTCLQSSKRFVITSSDDGTVKLWDVRTGEFIRNLVELGSGGSGGVVWRIRASATKLICAVGSRNGTEETKLLVLDFDVPGACRKCDD